MVCWILVGISDGNFDELLGTCILIRKPITPEEARRFLSRRRRLSLRFDPRQALYAEPIFEEADRLYDLKILKKGIGYGPAGGVEVGLQVGDQALIVRQILSGDPATPAEFRFYLWDVYSEGAHPKISDLLKRRKVRRRRRALARSSSFLAGHHMRYHNRLEFRQLNTQIPSSILSSELNFRCFVPRAL